MGVEDDKAGQSVEGNALVEEVHDEDAGGDEEDSALSVEGEAVGARVLVIDVGGEQDGGVLLQELLLDGAALGVGGRKHEDHTVRGRVQA